MPKAVVFPYGLALREGSRLSIFPAAELGFSTAKGEVVSLIFLVDSGAAISAMPKSDAVVLGLALSQGESATIRGVGGETILGRRVEMAVRLGSEKLRLPVVFLENDSVPRVLGREGVFNRFTIVFEEKRHRSAFLLSGSKESKSVQKVLDSVV